MKKVGYVASFRKSAYNADQQILVNEGGMLTGYQLDVENIHALVLPRGSVKAPA